MEPECSGKIEEAKNVSARTNKRSNESLFGMNCFREE